MARTPIKYRPWLSSSKYDLLVRKSVLHFDAFAYRDASHNVYIQCEFNEAGKRLLARDIYAVRGGQLIPVTDFDASGLTPLYWTRATAHHFAPVHAKLLSIARAGLPGRDGPVTMLFHYVTRFGGSPWPANLHNTFKYTMRADDPRLRRKQPLSAAIQYRGLRGTLPDIL